MSRFKAGQRFLVKDLAYRRETLADIKIDEVAVGAVKVQHGASKNWIRNEDFDFRFFILGNLEPDPTTTK